MKAYFIVLIVVILANVALMLFSMDRYMKSIATGSTDITFIVIGSLFLIFLLFIFAFIFSKVGKY